jgi:putative protein-disulfide isomerase
VSTQLLYVVDPMCSWCYGFAPALGEVMGGLAPGVEVDLVMGGLAPDSDEPMAPDMRSYVQTAWRAVEARTGVPFNHEFWQRCEPRRSTYTACRAVVVARESGLAWEMLAAIQRAYYREARNPSDPSILCELAAEIGLNAQAFGAELRASETDSKLHADLALRDRIGATSFPSLGVRRGDRTTLVASGCLGEAELRDALRLAGLMA